MINKKYIIRFAIITINLVLSGVSEAKSLTHLSSYQRTDPECYKEKFVGKVIEVDDTKKIKNDSITGFSFKSRDGEVLYVNIDLTDENGKHINGNVIQELIIYLNKGKYIKISAYWCAKTLTLESVN